MNNKKKYWRSATFLGAITLIAFGIGWRFYQQTITTTIAEFNYERDGAFVNKVFEDSKYWLLGEGLENYSLDHLLIKRVSNISPDQYGKENIKVLFKDNTPVGFVTYSKTKFWQGKVRLLGVDQEFRGHGYGLQLLNYAVNDLIAQGCTNIFLITRTTNYPAQKIYLKAGFKETWQDNGYVRFDYYVH